MTFSDAIRTCFSKFFTFSGRASRPEYWFFFLFIVIWSIIAGIIDLQFFTQVAVTETATSKSVSATSSGPVQSIVGLIVFFPHLAVAWRRMHDSGRSGLYALLPILLIVGGVCRSDLWHWPCLAFPAWRQFGHSVHPCHAVDCPTDTSRSVCVAPSGAVVAGSPQSARLQPIRSQPI